MNCGKCGAPLDNDALFCNNCGEKVEQPPAFGTAPQTNQASQSIPDTINTPTGYQVPPSNAVPPLAGVNYETPLGNGAAGNGDAAAASSKNKKIGLIAIIIAIVLVIVLLGSLVFKRSAKDCVKECNKAQAKASASKMLKLVPNKYQKHLMEEYDLSKKELKEAVQDYLDDNLDDWEDTYGDNISVKVKITDKDKVDKDDIKDINENFEDEDIKMKVSKGYEIEYDYEIKGDDDDDDGESVDYAIKVNGKWYSMEAIYFVSYAASTAD